MAAERENAEGTVAGPQDAGRQRAPQESTDKGLAQRQEQIRERIRAVGLRATAARVAVLAHIEDCECPATHGEVAEALGKEGMDRATVFRNLNDLSDKALIRRADFGDHVWRYETSAQDDHVHFVCNGCGVVQCLPKDTVTVHARKGTPRALTRSVDINLSGSCDACL